MGTTSIDINDIKWLREQTGAGVMEARKALQDAGGDREKARQLLQQRSTAGLQKRAGRITVQGLVEPYIHAGGQIGVLVELDSETDFVSRMPEFQELAHEIAMQVAATAPQYISMDEIPTTEIEQMRGQFRDDAVQQGKPENIAKNIAEGRLKKYAEGIVLLEQKYIRDDSKTIRQLVEDLAVKTRENIVVRRISRFQVGL